MVSNPELADHLVYQCANPAEALIPVVIFVHVELGSVPGSPERLVAVRTFDDVGDASPHPTLT